MRLLPTLGALLLIAGTAAAQPAPDQPQGPGPQDQAAPQYQPPAGAPLGPHGHPPMKVRFAAANTTNDGKLTLDQARAANMNMLVHNFDQIDSERKGYITLQDIRAWHQARHAAKQQQQ